MESNFNLDVVGPFKLELKAIKLLKKLHKSISQKKLLKMSCYSLFGYLVNEVNFKYGYLNDSDWYEVNTIKEYKNSYKNDIFKI